MIKTNEKESFRQIHLQVPASVHRDLKVLAAASDQTLTQLLLARVIQLVIGKQRHQESR